MKFKKAIIVFVCIVCLTSFGCAEEIVAYVNDRPITEAALQDRLQASNIINNYATAEMTQEEKDEVARLAREAALQILIEEEALLDEAENRGLSADAPKVKADADARYERMIASAEEYVKSSYPDLAGKELDAQVDELLRITGGTRESYYAIAQRRAVFSALDAALREELAAPAEEVILEHYEQLYLEQKELFDADHNSFEAAMLQKKIVVYRPTDLKMIKKAEFLFDSGALALIRQTAAINTDMAAEMRADQHRQMLPKVEAAHQALLAGEKTFEEVLEELKPGSSANVNYFHPNSTRFNEDYYSRANAFATVGEISSIYEMTTGYAILYYAGDMPACEKVPLEEVRDAIAAQIASESSVASLEEAKASIVSSADIRMVESESK